MKIKKIRWRGYKGLQDGSIVANGHDVIISGRNGVGKSSIAEILPFVLFGKLTGSIKRYDENGLTIRDRLTHGAEIEFDDGLTLRRELVDSTSGGQTAKLYINGAPVQKRQFDAKVEVLTNGAGELILNPFAFFAMTKKESRNFIARTFGTISEREILSTSENAELAAMLEDMPAEMFIAKCKSELKSKQLTAREIPARLEELENQIANTPKDINGTLKQIDADLTAKRSELAKLMTPTPQVQLPTQRINELERQENFLARQLERERARRESLLTDYRKAKAASLGNCPTCGQPMPLELFEAKRGERLLEITNEGQLCAAQIAEFEAELKATCAELETNRAKAEQLTAEAARSAQAEKNRVERLTALQGEINGLESEKLRLKSAAQIGKRIEQIRAQERSLNVEIAKLEGNLARAEKFQYEKIQRFEDEINSNFRHVKFKLFDKRVDGTPYEVCEAMLDGVPYSALSKGEKLKAALDIWRAIQRHYGAELPLIIDDAESYTANSLVDVPNQKILLRVAESELVIEVDEGRQAA